MRQNRLFHITTIRDGRNADGWPVLQDILGTSTGQADGRQSLPVGNDA